MNKDRTRTASASPTTTVPAPRREPAPVYDTEPLNADAAAALDRLYSRIYGVSEAA